jgi:DNA polymerase type B, organellar and viral
MAPRYSHYLLPAKGGRFPSRVICLAVVGSPSGSSVAAGAERSTLTGWSAILLVRQSGQYIAAGDFAATRADDFWDLLRGPLGRPGTTWVVSPYACRCWALLGLWQRLEDGLVTLRRPAAPLTARTVSAGRASREGTLVDTDPPSLLRCWIPGLPGTLVWCDPRNWGAGCSAWTGGPALVARRTAGLVQSWCTALQSLFLGSLQATAGSQALHGWQAGHFWPGVWAHVHPGALQLEADGFHGGRAEAHRLGKVEGLSYYLDIRSAYAWACATYDLPVRLGGYAEGDRALDLIQQHGAWNCLADVSLETDYPLFPVRKGPDTIYPVGRFRCVLPGPELVVARTMSWLHKVHRVAWYTCAPALRDYAKYIHTARSLAEANGNTDLASCLKQLLVALPGKLAQKAWHWQSMPNLPAPAPYASWSQPTRDGGWVRYRSVAFLVQRCVPMGWAPDAVPAIAAWITSAVRVRLLEEIETAGWEHTIYNDTDGLIVLPEGYRRLGSPLAGGRGALGELTLRAVLRDLEVRGIKHYRAGDLTVCAGLPQGAPVQVEGKERWWEDVTPTEQIRRRVRPDALRELRPFQRGPAYRHGVVGPDGRVAPIRLEEW